MTFKLTSVPAATLCTFELANTFLNENYVSLAHMLVLRINNLTEILGDYFFRLLMVLIV